MSLSSSESQLVGLDDSHLEAYQHTRLLPTVCEALASLQEDARRAGFNLQIASGYRDFFRQLKIWNAKICGDRPVLNDDDEQIDLGALSVDERLRCVLRFSALPGASRHHWGTEVDVFDAAAMADGYRLKLNLAEVADTGMFGPLHGWLDERIDGGESYGFFRPYANDRGAVAPERWHLSYAPLAASFQAQMTEDLLRRAWASLPHDANLALQTEIEDALPLLLRRYVLEVDEPGDAARHFTPVTPGPVKGASGV